MTEPETRNELTGDLRHEPPGVNAPLLLLTTLGLVALTVGALGVVSLLFNSADHAPEIDSERRVAQSLAAASAPLDMNQEAHRLSYEAGQRKLLESYGWVDRKGGVAHIPIDRAIKLIVEGHRATP